MSEVNDILIKDIESEKKIDLTIPFSIIKIEMEKELEKLQKTYKMNGFRAGKVPVDIIKKNEEDRLFLRASEKTINSTIETKVFPFMEEKGKKVSIYEDYEIKKLEKGLDIEISFKYDLVPEIPEIDYENIELNKYEIDFKEEDLNRYIEATLKHNAKFTKQDSEYLSKMNDMVKISYFGTIDDVPFDGGKSDEYNLVLGSNSFIDSFEEQLVGKKTGDEVLVKVKFPDNYHQKALAGKDAEFQTKILEVSIKEDAELTDEFAKNVLGVDNVEEYKRLLTLKVKEEYGLASKSKLKEDLFKYFKDTLTFDVPERYVEQQQKHLKDKPVEEIKKQIRLFLLVDKVRKENNLEPSEEEIMNGIMQKALSTPGYEKQIIDLYKKQEYFRQMLINEISESKFVDFVVEKIKTKEIHISIEEFEKLE